MELPGLSFKKQLDTFVDDVKGQFGRITIFIAAIWVVFLISYIPFLDLNLWLALRPRNVPGLIGVVTMPFVHGGFAHIISNTIPLIITLVTLAALRPKTWPWVVALLIVVSGALTWLIGGANQVIVGASGLVLGLVTFLIAPGGFLLGWWGYHKLRKQSKPYPYKIRMIPLVVSGLVGFFCLDNLLFNLVPIFAPMGGSNVSWRAHWCGAVAGCLVAFLFARSGQTDELPSEIKSVMEDMDAAPGTSV